MTYTYFYTTHYPHRWTSGTRVHTLDPENGYEPIGSLKRARELAKKNAVKSSSDDRVTTTYGKIHGEF